MPRMNNPPASQHLVKLLLIGDGKLGKSYYAGLAAKAGFNVLYLDGDVGAQTIGSMVADKTLSAEEASRIYLLDIGDTILSGMKDTNFAEFMDEFVTNTVVRWNDTDQRIGTRRDTDKEIWEIRPGRLGPNDLLVLDSWTGYVESLMTRIGRANGVDIANASTTEMRPVYQGGALKASELLQVIRSLPCHVIVIAHPDEYQHVTLKEGTVKGKANEKDQIVDWTKMIPKTTSKPQGLTMAKYFTDVAWMELSPAGTERRLNFKPKNDRISGGHFTDSKSVEEYSFINLAKTIGFKGVELGDPAWLTIIPPGESKPEESKVLDGTTATPVKGIAGLMKKA